jgi:regulator of ribonuclease activity A
MLFEGVGMAISTSDVLDRHEEAQVCNVAMRLFGRKRSLAARVRTVRCFEDNALIKALMAEPSNNEVLVVDGEGSLRTALMGDMIAGTGAANGWAGAIVFGAIRDSVAIDGLEFHVKALGTNPRRSSKNGTGERDVVLRFGDVRIAPGDILYSDDDGIVILAGPESDGVPD